MKLFPLVLLLILSACEKKPTTKAATWRGPDWQPEQSETLGSVQHEGHWYVVRGGRDGFFINHPDCPLCGKNQKSNETIERPTPAIIRP